MKLKLYYVTFQTHKNEYTLQYTVPDIHIHYTLQFTY